MISRDLLRRIEGFKGMNDEQLAAVGTCCRELDFKPGDRLFKEGDPATHLWFVENGKVELRFELPGRETTSEHTVSSIEAAAGDASAQAIGWSCFVAPFMMRLSAYCASPNCKAIRIKKEDLLALFQGDPQMGYLFMAYMITVVGHRFHSFQDYVATHLGRNLISGW